VDSYAPTRYPPPGARLPCPDHSFPPCSSSFPSSEGTSVLPVIRDQVGFLLTLGARRSPFYLSTHPDSLLPGMFFCPILFAFVSFYVQRFSGHRLFLLNLAGGRLTPFLPPLKWDRFYSVPLPNHCVDASCSQPRTRRPTRYVRPIFVSRLQRFLVQVSISS